jgi:Domain of unknown function (DUF222)
MSSSPSPIVAAASGVAIFGACQGDIDRLDESSLKAGMAAIVELDRQAQTYKLWFATAIAKQSDHTLGYDGLARRNGSATPAVFIQSMTGSSIEEATKLARLAQSMADAEVAGLEQTPVSTAAISGGISLDAADAIRRGLGQPDAVVTASQLAAAAEELISRAGAMTPEALLKAARQARNDLDLDAIERGEKQRSMVRYVRTWSRDGLSGGSWALPDEDGGIEIRNALKLLVAKKTNGPRFADVSKETVVSADLVEPAHASEPADESARGPASEPADESAGGPASDEPASAVPEDDRTPEQIMADGFAQIFHNGLTADPSIVPGAGRAPVRVIVPAAVLTDRLAGGPDGKPYGSALLEETTSAITFGKLEEYLCEGGTIAIGFDHNGDPLNVGREQRLFTRAQRTALGVRDGGCRFPGCDKPPSWTEAHHTDYWARDKGRTDIAKGILFCRYHHMLVHNKGWEIILDAAGDYWLKPPKERDPRQALIAMPSKNPLVAAMKRARGTDPTR